MPPLSASSALATKDTFGLGGAPVDPRRYRRGHLPVPPSWPMTWRSSSRPGHGVRPSRRAHARTFPMPISEARQRRCRPSAGVATVGAVEGGPAGNQLRRRHQRLGQPVPGRLQRDPQPRITACGGPGAALLCRAEHRADPGHRGHAEHVPFPRVRIGAVTPSCSRIPATPSGSRSRGSGRSVTGSPDKSELKAIRRSYQMSDTPVLIPPLHHADLKTVRLQGP